MLLGIMKIVSASSPELYDMLNGSHSRLRFDDADRTTAREKTRRKGPQVLFPSSDGETGV